MNLDLQRVVRFCVVVEEMSFTKAAKRLFVDQAWLSRQIQQLEEQLGFRLFERTTRKISLTPEGARFHEKAAQLAEVTKSIKAVARLIHDELHGHLRIGVSPASFWLPERDTLFTDFRALNPNFEVDIKTAFTPRLLSGIETRKLDLAITTPFCDHDSVEYVPIHRSSPGILVPQELDLASKPEIRMADLRGFTFGVPTSKENPLSFQNQYQPFLDAGVIPRVVPEGRLAIFHYAAKERFLMLGFKAEKVSLASSSLVYRDIVDGRALLELGLSRLRGDDRAAVGRMWTMARKLNAKVPPLWAH